MDQYRAILESQNFRCAICRTDKQGGGRRYFDVDHDHITNRVRGLLCMFCNNGLGCFKDDKQKLEKAIRYLKQHNEV